MHHSRVSTLMIDCLADDFDASLDFWSAALGLKPARRPGPKQRYVTLGQLEGPITVRLQKVTRDAGYHLDMETDDKRAETRRLETVGARRKYRIRRWWVMEDPSGNAFCVIAPESRTFPRHARSWPGAAQDEE
ncbi:MAG: VOC family protein [Gammaproteobacteria bacterium]|jgi:hypothetical protein